MSGRCSKYEKLLLKDEASGGNLQLDLRHEFHSAKLGGLFTWMTRSQLQFSL